ncbi:MAG: transposase [Candidatus Limnocylindrales bacterium]
MDAEVTEITGVPHGERNPERRLTHRNGYRDRRWDTRVGTMSGRMGGATSGRRSSPSSTPSQTVSRRSCSASRTATCRWRRIRRLRGIRPTSGPRMSRARSRGRSAPSHQRVIPMARSVRPAADSS